MARRKPAKKAKAKSARKAKKKAAPKKAARRTAKASKKAAKKTARKAAKKVARKASKPASSSSAKASADRRKAAKPARKQRVVADAGRAMASGPGTGTAHSGKKKPNLDRPRKTVADVHGIPSSLDMGRTASAAKTGRAEMRERLTRNTSVSPALTAGDIDADWESAESAGDEAPGGDNTTPDQDVVDDIGRALGVEYEDDEELQGGAEIADRDRNRWELDPSSKDDFDDES